MKYLKGKWAVVTGASRGIGRVISRALAEQGCNLILHSRSVKCLAELQRKAEEMGVECIVIEQDFLQENGAECFWKKVKDTNIPVDILINNAGVNISIDKENRGEKIGLNYWTQEEYEQSTRVNIVLPAFLSAKILPEMMARKTGCILTLTSGIHGSADHFIYSVTKGAVNKMTTDLAEIASGSGVTVCAMDPGWCQTYLGGEGAVDKAENVAPGVLVPILLKEQANGKIFHAQRYAGMSVEDALELAKKE